MTSRMTSSPTGRLMPGITNIRSSTCSSASTRWRTDWGSFPKPGNGGLFSPEIGMSVSATRLLLQVGERVTSEAVPGKALNAPGDEGPTDGGGDRNEQLLVVDHAGGLVEQRVPLRWNRSEPRGIEQLVHVGVADRNRAATETAHEPSRRCRGCDFVDQRKVG